MARVILLMILSLIFFFFLLKEGRAIRIGVERMAVRVGGEKGAISFSWPGPQCARWFMGSSAQRLSRESCRSWPLDIGVPNPVFIGTVAGVFALIPIGLIQVILLPAAGWLIYKARSDGEFFSLSGLLQWSVHRHLHTPMLISRAPKFLSLLYSSACSADLPAGGILGLFVGATLLSVFTRC